MLFLPSGLRLYCENSVVDVDYINIGDTVCSFDTKTKVTHKYKVDHPIYEINSEFGSVLSGLNNKWGVSSIYNNDIEYMACSNLNMYKKSHKLVFSQYISKGDSGTHYKGFLYGLILSNYIKKFLLYDNSSDYNLIKLEYPLNDIPSFLSFFNEINLNQDIYKIENISSKILIHGNGSEEITIDYLIKNYKDMVCSVDKNGHLSISIIIGKEFLEEIIDLLSDHNFNHFSSNILKKSFKYRLNFLSGFFSAYNNSEIHDFRYSKDKIGYNYIDIIQEILSSVGILSFISKHQTKSGSYYSLTISPTYYSRLIDNDHICNLGIFLKEVKQNKACYYIFDVIQRVDLKNNVWAIGLEHDVPVIVSGMICR